MPRNNTGGSGHRAQRNSESNKEKHNRTLIDDWLDDIRLNRGTEGIFIGRVSKRLGNGRMEVINKETTYNIPLRGGMKGRGRKDVWVDVGSVILFAETFLGGFTHEIVAVLTPNHIKRYRELVPDADPALFVVQAETAQQEDGFEFSEEAEVNIDAI